MALHRNGFLRGVWSREQREIMWEVAAAGPWPNGCITMTTACWWSACWTQSPSLQETKVVCCWCVVNLNSNGVKPSQMAFQIPGGLLDLGWSVGQSFLLHILDPPVHIICQGILNLIPKFWLCWGTCGQILHTYHQIYTGVRWGPSLWLGASRTLPGILVHRSGMRHPGLLRWKKFWRDSNPAPSFFRHGSRVPGKGKE